MRQPQTAPVFTDTNAACGFAWNHAERPDDEQHSAKAS